MWALESGTSTFSHRTLAPHLGKEAQGRPVDHIVYLWMPSPQLGQGLSVIRVAAAGCCYTLASGTYQRRSSWQRKSGCVDLQHHRTGDGRKNRLRAKSWSITTACAMSDIWQRLQDFSVMGKCQVTSFARGLQLFPSISRAMLQGKCFSDKDQEPTYNTIMEMEGGYLPTVNSDPDQVYQWFTL